jgi:hypothetical protein
MTAYCKIASARSLSLDQGAMSKIEIFWQKAAEFDELAAQASSPGLRDSYATVAQSYRRLVQFMESQTPNGRQPKAN